MFVLMVTFPRAGQRKAGRDWRAARPPLTEIWLQRMTSSPGGEQSGRPSGQHRPSLANEPLWGGERVPVSGPVGSAEDTEPL